MTPQERFRALWAKAKAGSSEIRPGDMVPASTLAPVAEFWFTLGMAESAQLIKDFKPVVRMTKPSSDGYVAVVDAPAMLRALYAAVTGCESPGGG